MTDNLVKLPRKGENKGKPDAQLKAKELAKRAAAGDPDALKALEKIVVCFERWKKALADQREVNRTAKELEGGRAAAFENAVEEGVPTNPNMDQVWGKLRLVEEAWQEHKEAIAKAAEMRTAAAEKVKKRGGELERAAQDGAQMTIPGTDD